MNIDPRDLSAMAVNAIARAASVELAAVLSECQQPLAWAARPREACDAMEAAGPPGRYFCHNCRVEFQEPEQNFQCPYCHRGFIEQVENPRPTTESEDNAQALGNNPQPVTPGQYSDVGIDDLDEPPPPGSESGDRWSSWSPPWNYRDSNNPSSNGGARLGNDLSFLMSGDRVRAFSSTMRIGNPEMLIQQIVWQITGGRTPGQQMLFLGSDPSGDYPMTNESLDAIMSQLLWNSDTDGPPPLAQEFIDNLPEISINEEQVAGKLQCSVCWEVYNLDEKVRQLKCGHMYHKACIFPWLSLHATCPICRSSLAPPEEANTEQWGPDSRDPNQPPNSSQQPNSNMPATNLASLFLRICGGTPGNPPAGPPPNIVPTGWMSAMNTPPSSSAPGNPAPANAAPNTAVPNNAAPTDAMDTDNVAPDNENSSADPAVSTAPTDPTQPPPTNANPGQRRHFERVFPNGHIMVVSAGPNSPMDNLGHEYLTIFATNNPISSSTVSSTTSDGNTRSTNLDMDLD